VHGNTICLPNLRPAVQARDELTPVSVTGRIREAASLLGFTVGQPALSPTFSSIFFSRAAPGRLHPRGRASPCPIAWCILHRPELEAKATGRER